MLKKIFTSVAVSKPYPLLHSTVVVLEMFLILTSMIEEVMSVLVRTVKENVDDNFPIGLVEHAWQ